MNEGKQLCHEILWRLPLEIMTDLAIDPDGRAGNDACKLLLLGPSKDSVPITAEDQGRAVDRCQARREISVKQTCKGGLPDPRRDLLAFGHDLFQERRWHRTAEGARLKR